MSVWLFRAFHQLDKKCPNKWHLLPNGLKTRWTRFVEIRWPYPSRSFRNCGGRRSSLRGKNTLQSLRTQVIRLQEARPFGARRKSAKPKSSNKWEAPRTKKVQKWPSPRKPGARFRYNLFRPLAINLLLGRAAKFKVSIRHSRRRRTEIYQRRGGVGTRWGFAR